jgi:hypothetical protein
MSIFSFSRISSAINRRFNALATEDVPDHEVQQKPAAPQLPPEQPKGSIRLIHATGKRSTHPQILQFLKHFTKSKAPRDGSPRP